MKSTGLALIFFAALLHYTESWPVIMRYHGLSWQEYLRGIAYVESRNRQFAYSYLGEDYGRGLHGVSAIMWEQFKWHRPDHWAVKQNLGPDCLYNVTINSDVALYALEWLDRIYTGHPDKIRRVLSAYNQGYRHTEEHGLAMDYVTKVLTAMGEQ